MSHQNPDILNRFHPLIQAWFRESFAQPTPSQQLGWQPIFNREHTLILAPTGSGKTLAAFLVCINELLEKLLHHTESSGVHTLYISPLKALNYDIERNLESPLSGIQKKAATLGLTFPDIKKAVRTGDTTQKERQQMLKHPPHILITTPESLHLMLTSHKARELLSTVEFVIVDEIHALSENKRGTFLSLLLERLQHAAQHPFTRIGLSATQKPLEEIAKFLGGYDVVQQGDMVILNPRPVTIIDAGIRKQLDLQIISPVEDFTALPEETVWPDIYQKLLELIQSHKSTLIFTNNRAAAERITSEINERAGYELARAHHGSVSKTKRHEIETLLKQGKLPALVATATLELGIDMGSIDLVCQVESPKSVARGLQRVGRAGHLYKSISKGRLIPKMRSDLLEMAAITLAMKQGDVSPIKIPRNCLDILAQQIVAAVSITSWKLDDLYLLVRQAFPYKDLQHDHFLGVVEMLSGRYPAEAFRELKPRISWDRVNNMLHQLPGSQRLAILGGGAIPETGQFGCYLEDEVTKIGELDEEFIYERRLGEVFVLGTNNWRIKKITHDRVIVAPAPGEPARMPFWKGEYFHRSYHLGRLYGQFCRECSQRLTDAHFQQWLQQHYSMDSSAAQNAQQYLSDQIESSGIVPDDRHILIESFHDELGDLRIIILSPFGGRLHLPWRLALLSQFRKQWNVEPESLYSDSGIVLRFPSEKIDSILQIIRSVTSHNFETLVVDELANSSFFGLRFRQNAGRALLLPGAKPGKRTPLWLHRIRARDLLEISRQYPSFPIVMETYRECLQDFLAIEELKELLLKIETGEVQLVVKKSTQPSPFASSLMFEFMGGYMYEYDAPKGYADGARLLDKDQLAQLIHPQSIHALLKNEAIQDVERRLQAEQPGYQARAAAELAELLLRIGDLTDEEITARVHDNWQDLVKELCRDRRITKIFIPKSKSPWRWIAAEDFPLYQDAFAIAGSAASTPESYQYAFFMIENSLQPVPINDAFPLHLFSQKWDHSDARTKIIYRFIKYHSLVTIDQICKRYPLPITEIQTILEKLQRENALVQLPSAVNPQDSQWIFNDTLERIRRVTLVHQRRQVQPCNAAQFASFLLHWQHRTPTTQLSGQENLATSIEQLQGLSLPASLWESEVFNRRLCDYQPSWLDTLINQGELIWFGARSSSSTHGNITFAFREDLQYFLESTTVPDDESSIHENISKIKSVLNRRGALFISDISSETGLVPSVCARTLWEMIWRGEITNDTFAIIRAGKPREPSTEFTSSPFGGNASRAYQRASRFRPQKISGRWSLFPLRPANLAMESAEIEALTRQLLQRYGLLCHEIYHLENQAIPWSRIYEMLTQMEWRGEIQRGYFVNGLSGVQFALPQAADQLRAFGHKQPGYDSINSSDDTLILLNTCDPANLYGAASPMPVVHPFHHEWRLLRHPNNYLILKQGCPIVAIEAKGNRLTALRDLTTEEKKQVAQLLPRLFDDPAHWRRIRSIKVETWNDQPIRTTDIAALLKEIGFRDEFKMMILERTID